MNEQRTKILKSTEMRQLYAVAKEKKIITLEDVMVIYTSKQHAKQIVGYFIRNGLLAESNDGYLFVDEQNEDTINHRLDGGAKLGEV